MNKITAGRHHRIKIQYIIKFKACITNLEEKYIHLVLK